MRNLKVGLDFSTWISNAFDVQILNESLCLTCLNRLHLSNCGHSVELYLFSGPQKYGLNSNDSSFRGRSSSNN
jgi:hypothetical protein